MNTKKLGDVGVVRVLLALIEEGFSVSVPWGDSVPYDLVVDTGSQLIRLQVKTIIDKGNGSLRVKTCSITTRNGKPVTRNYTPEMVDFLAAYDRAHDCTYVLPSCLWSEITGGNIWLRTKPSKNGQVKGVHTAEQYRNAWYLLRELAIRSVKV